MGRVAPHAFRFAALAVGVASLSCARQGRIPGGPPDRIAPIVVAVEPEPETIVHDWDGPIRIEFNERISERSTEGSLDGAVLISPAVEGVRVAHSRTGLEVSVPGGFPEGRVYRVTVLPAISDLFSNRMRDPFEFVFSTGPEISGAVAAGVVEDRLTGQPTEVRVDAIGQDSIVHFTQTDASGLFALRYLPPGRYQLRAYEDRNRNGEPDFSEPQGTLPIGLPSNADTSITSLVVLLPDSTLARLVRAEVVDSVSVRIEFDDYLDPEEDVALVGVRLAPDTAIADSLMPEAAGTPPTLERVLHEHAFQEFQTQMAQLRAAEAAEEARAQADSTGAEPPPAREAPAPGEPEQDSGPPRPGQALVVVFDRALQPHFPYRIEVTGVRNINALPLGGGSLGVVWTPPVADSLQADSTGVPADTAGVVVDTTQAGPVPVLPPPDTTVPPDTIRLPQQ